MEQWAAVDKENGSVYGPFPTRQEAVNWAHDVVLALGEISLQDEADAQRQGLTSVDDVAQDLEAMEWAFLPLFPASDPNEFRNLEDEDRGTGPDRYPPIIRDASGRPTDVG